MFWADHVAEQIRTRYKEKIKKGEPIVIRDEKTLSGRVHVGSLRGVAIHGIVSEVLREEGIKNTFLFEFNDFDPMDGLPVYLDKEKFLPHMGKLLCEVPSSDGKTKNYAEYFGGELQGVIKEAGFEPEYYRSSELYRSGKYNEVIRKALLKADVIRDIYKRVSGSQKEDHWLPLNVVCEQCGKVGTTRAVNFDGTTVEYSCGKYVEWAEGCGHKGKVSPFDGRAKLPWKVEWAAKFSVMNVDVEGGGKDHSTKGGSREIADAISREVFDREPPINIPYEFFVVGGKKMSSSKGAGSSAREVADLLPPHILRFLLINKEPQRVIDFIPDGDTVPVLYDTYDRFADNYFSGNKDDFARVFPFSYPQADRKNLKKKTLPRFSTIAFLVQMPHLNIIEEIERIMETKLTNEDKKELSLRARYAKIWLDTYAPEDYKYEIQKTLPVVAKNLSELQKKALGRVLVFVESKESISGQEFHLTLHGIKEELGIAPKDFFEALYLSILGKKNGPKAGWFLSVLDREFLINRLKEATS